MTSQVRGNELSAKALWYESPGIAALREEVLDMPDLAKDRPGQAPSALVRTHWSAISRGTERLVMAGKVPAGEYGRMRAPFQSGNFPFPVKYGYCAAGVVEDGPAAMCGKSVFALFPHQDRFVLPTNQLCVLPEILPLRRAPLAANMETALNAVWDSGAGPGDNIFVIGAGIVGLLITYLCARLPGANVTAIDPLAERASLVELLGASYRPADTQSLDFTNSDASEGADIVFHTSASAQGLTSAISLAGLEGKIVEVSWYGDKEIAVPLGGAFHSRRLQLISTQVGHVAPSRRPRWSYHRRLSKALELLCDDRLDGLITDECAFEDLPQKLPGYLSGQSAGLATLVRY